MERPDSHTRELTDEELEAGIRKVNGYRIRIDDSVHTFLGFEVQKSDPHPLARYKRYIRASEAELQDESFQPNLCSRCRTIRWSAFAETELPSTDEYYIGTIEEVRELQKSTCQFCWLVASAREAVFTGYASLFLGHYPSFYPSSADLGYDETNEKDYPILKIEFEDNATSYFRMAPTKDQMHIPTAKPHAINFDVIKQWFTACVRVYTNSERQEYGHPCQADGTVDVPGFCVIDCNARAVVPAPKYCKYLALSYVWGTNIPAVSKEEDHTHYPATIEDSMSLTLNLGFQYLWVDRYCIDQQNAWTKHIQISNMDAIYAHSYATIIAAAGDAGFGLPGISRPRTLGYRVSDVEFLQLRRVKDVLWGVSASKWASRGWTFQEGLLSRRRIIFTEKQIIFVCRQMACHERQPGRYSIINARYNDFDEALDACGLSMVNMQSTWNVLEYYTNRKLTFDSDIFNACRGVLQDHIWGVPVFRSRSPEILLHWSVRNAECVRRPEYPSWSWLGWRCRLNRPTVRDIYTKIRDTPVPDIIAAEVLNESGQWETVGDYVGRNKDKAHGYQSKKLRLTTLSLDHLLDIRRYEGQNSARLQISLLSSHKSFFVEIDDQLAVDQGDALLPLQLWHPDLKRRPHRTNAGDYLVVLLVKSVGEAYQRVGLAMRYVLSGSAESNIYEVIGKEAKPVTIVLE